MSDPDQPGEAFDEEMLAPDEYPPDRPIGLDDEEDAYVEDDFVEEEEGEVEDVEAVTDEDDDLLFPNPQDPGPLAEDDEFTGDETTRDVATERVPPPAEEAALHVEPEDDIEQT